MANTANFVTVKDAETGEAFIPASQRPDGTWRKARRVKEGYVPQEEVPVYESKGKQWAKSQLSHPIGLNPQLLAAKETKPSIPGLPPATATAVSKKKKKKKANKPAEEESSVKELTTQVTDLKLTEDKTTTNVQNTDPAKKLKALKKKLKDISMLEKNISSGELKNPEKEQLEKIQRKTDIEEEIRKLESSL
nr:EOG090X0KVN [Triops cancriformis]